MTTPSFIVAGVGPTGSRAAVEFAAAEARRTDAGLRLVHVLRVAADAAWASAWDMPRDEAERLLDRAEEVARAITPNISRHLVERGWTASDLLEAAADARLLVLEHRHHHTAHRLLVGSTVGRTAAHSAHPVVSVPEGWRQPDTAGPVVVAAQDQYDAAHLLRIGFEQAHARTTSLQVVHAWWLAASFDVAIVDIAIQRDWAERAMRDLRPSVDALRAEFPEVAVSVDVRHAPATIVLLHAAEQADLLVVGRRDHRRPRRTHLGPVSRTVLRHSPCPVLVAPEARTSPSKPARLGGRPVPVGGPAR